MRETGEFVAHQDTDHDASRNVEHVVRDPPTVGKTRRIAGQQTQPAALLGGVGAIPVLSRSKSATGPAGVPGAAMGAMYVTSGSRSLRGGVGIGSASP